MQHRNHLYEFIGTFFFIFIIIYTENALASGAALAIVMMSGSGEYNPVVSFVNLLKGKYSIHEAIPIILIQFAAGLAALEIIKRFL